MPRYPKRGPQTMALLLLLSAACRMPTPEEQRALQEERRRTVRQAADKLAAMHDAFPGSGLEDGGCPQSRIADIMQRHPNQRQLPTAELGFLERYTGGAVSGEPEGAPWSFLTHALIRHLEDDSRMPADYRAREQAKRAKAVLEVPLMVVFRTEGRTEPQVSTPERNIWVISGGSWHGWAGVYDMEREDYLCFARVGTGHVNVSDSASERSTPEAVVAAAFRDLAQQLGSRTNETLKRLSPKLGWVLL
jgi:hypothetical protein